MNTYYNEIGKSRGHFDNTENRIQKLSDNWELLKEKFGAMIIRGKLKTETSRCAYATLLIMETGIRVGNESSAEGYTSINKYSKYHNKIVKTYGITTLLKEHVVPRPNYIIYKFLGKKQVEQYLETKNPILVKWTLSRLRELKKNTDSFLGIDYYTLQKFIKRYVGKKFKPKDLRQAYVNRIFIGLHYITDYDNEMIRTKAEVNRTIRNQVVQTAEIVGHTPTVCKSSYITKSLMNFHKDNLLMMLDNYKRNKK